MKLSHLQRNIISRGPGEGEECSELKDKITPYPNELFNFYEYKEYVRDYYDNGYKTPIETWRQQILNYRSRLPIYLLARCPICGGTVSEPIDTFSLCGPGWGKRSRGYGWFGTIEEGWDPVKRRYWQKPSYTAECQHAKIVEWSVNLNGIEPTDVTFEEIYIYHEIPLLLAVPMEAEGVVAVMHTLPIGRFDDPEPTPRYTAFFTTYFAANNAAYEQAMQKVAEYGEGSIATPPYDWDFEKYLQTKRLYWLDGATSDLKLRNEPAQNFPYLHVTGHNGMYLVIRNGKLEGYNPFPGETFPQFVARKFREMLRKPQDLTH